MVTDQHLHHVGYGPVLANGRCAQRLFQCWLDAEGQCRCLGGGHCFPLNGHAGNVLQCTVTSRLLQDRDRKRRLAMRRSGQAIFSDYVGNDNDMKRPWENDSCATVQACYAVYHVPEAAALWCGVPADQVTNELRHAIPIGQSNALGRATLRHPYLKCLEPRIRAIHAAIDAGELPACREDGRKTDEHVAYERRHVYGLDLKEWAKKIAPSERPAFLFDEIERDVHTGISAEVYRTLKAAHDARGAKLSQANERIREAEEERGRAEMERDALRKMVADLSSKLQAAGAPGERSETSYLNIIAALLDCIAGNLPNVAKHPSFPSEAKLIETLDEHFRGYGGLSKSNLSRKFPEAKRAMRAQ